MSSTQSIVRKTRAYRGKTVGRSIIKSFIHDFLHGQEDDFKPLYTQSRFNAMVEGIQSDHEYNVYLHYVSLLSGLTEELVRSQAYTQQAQHALAHLQHVVSDLWRGHALRTLFDALQTMYGFAMDPQAQAVRGGIDALLLTMDTIDQNPQAHDSLHSYYQQLLLPALRGLCSYNVLVDLLAKSLNFDELRKLAAPLDDIERDIAVFDETLRTAAEAMNGTLPETLFPPISIAAYAPDPVAVEKAMHTLADPKNIQNSTVQQLFILLLEATP